MSTENLTPELEKGTDLFSTHLLGCDFLRKEIAYAQNGKGDRFI
ncbi:hypothetical protein [Pseudomonas edaphica]